MSRPCELADLSPVLIVGRGEIAVRIARTLTRLGLESAGVFTAVDAGALHVDCVDHAIRVGSYLEAGDLLAAARAVGARSIHPGYGFLSEDPEFAAAVQAAGLVWIGPPPEAISLMGDKARAKAAAIAAGVPVVPEPAPGEFPIVVKALSGGGGKGTRVVRSADQLEAATAAARREAMAAFGDDRVLLERWLEAPRHIEIQVLADAHGTVVHLGERECSLQRRLQKVVEEAPAPGLGAELRERIATAALALARACGYEGAGTVEFVVPRDRDEFFFLEMNTRLQVEHPVTELVYGVDLVEWQLRIAAGEPLTLDQASFVPRGHAIEARVYAESPAAGFLPATGTVRSLSAPVMSAPAAQAGETIRLDLGVREGSEVGTAYDPMLGKVIAHAPTRPHALRLLDRALAELSILGVDTSAAFTRALLAEPQVRAGELDTGLLERLLSGLAVQAPEDLLLAAALVAAGTARPEGVWWRVFEQGEVRVASGRVERRGRSWEAEIRPLGGVFYAIELDGLVHRYAALATAECVWVNRDAHHLAARTQRRQLGGAGPAPGSLESPMPGTVIEVSVRDGETVAAGALLLVIESMKMELSITAPHGGRVHGLVLAPGDRVERGQPLLSVAAGEDAT